MFDPAFCRVDAGIFTTEIARGSIEDPSISLVLSDGPPYTERYLIERKRPSGNCICASTSPAKAKAFPRTGSVVASPPMLRERRAGSSPWAWMRSGLIDVCKQRPASAIERLLIALDLARDDPLAFNSLIGIGCAHFHAGRYAEAAHWFEQAIAEHPSGVWMHYLLCPAHVLSGRKPEARRSLIHLQRSHPHLTTSRVIAGLTFFSEVVS